MPFHARAPAAAPMSQTEGERRTHVDADNRATPLTARIYLRVRRVWCASRVVCVACGVRRVWCASRVVCVACGVRRVCRPGTHLQATMELAFALQRTIALSRLRRARQRGARACVAESRVLLLSVPLSRAPLSDLISPTPAGPCCPTPRPPSRPQATAQ
jgi:hypothetical protein